MTYEFPQYAPDWGQGDDENEDVADEFFWSESMVTLHQPEFVVDVAEDIRWKHVVKAMQTLVKTHQTDGPFTAKQIADEVTKIIIDETLQQMIKDGLIEIYDGDKVRLTPTGKAMAKMLTEEENNE